MDVPIDISCIDTDKLKEIFRHGDITIVNRKISYLHSSLRVRHGQVVLGILSSAWNTKRTKWCISVVCLAAYKAGNLVTPMS